MGEQLENTNILNLFDNSDKYMPPREDNTDSATEL